MRHTALAAHLQALPTSSTSRARYYRRFGYHNCLRHRSAAALRPNVCQAAATSQTAQQQASSDLFEDFLLNTQDDIIQAAEALDGSGRSFVRDRWERDPANPNAGYGITTVLEDGGLLEKAAVNVSVVRGQLSAARAQAMSSRGRGVEAGQGYAAAALSLVLHPAHPHVPTLRADVRLFQVGRQAWYGGGCDLTPAYLYEEDAREFHSFWKQVCGAHSPDIYPAYKAWCDRYFWLPARKEHRGIGGVFFDDLPDDEQTFDSRQFVEDVGRGIIPSWQPIVQRRRELPSSEEEREWQLLRRGRYLEFNLLYDRGVKFGLDGGRVESIMVSAPPLIAWKYNRVPEEGSREAALLEVLRQPHEWA